MPTPWASAATQSSLANAATSHGAVFDTEMPDPCPMISLLLNGYTRRSSASSSLPCAAQSSLFVGLVEHKKMKEETAITAVGHLSERQSTFAGEPVLLEGTNSREPQVSAPIRLMYCEIMPARASLWTVERL